MATSGIDSDEYKTINIFPPTVHARTIMVRIGIVVTHVPAPRYYDKESV